MMSSRNSGEAIDFLHSDYQQKQLFLKKLLGDYLKIGFLMQFCEAQYCTESIRFIVAVSKFRNIFSNDGIEWDHWANIDKYEETEKERKLNLAPIHEDKTREIKKDLEYLSNTFLDPSAKLEICLSSAIAKRTRQRMAQYQLYGPGIFQEACSEPKDTLIRDILPRFVVSTTYQDMLYYTAKINKLPSADTVKIPLPLMSHEELIKICDNYKSDEEIKRYISDDVAVFVHDPLLYPQFLKYLQRIISSENLLCIRAIDMYCQYYEDYRKASFMDPVFSTKDFFNDSEDKSGPMKSYNNSNNSNSGEKSSTHNHSGMNSLKHGLQSRIVEQAWFIYLHFIEADSCYQVGLSHNIINSVTRNMASPLSDMFKAVRSAAYKVLWLHFDNFKESPNYLPVFELCKERRLNYMKQIEVNHNKEKKKNAGCFSW